MGNLNNQNILTEIQFSEYFFEKLKNKVHDISLEKIENLEIYTKYKNDEKFIHFLGNAYSEYCVNNEELSEIIERYLEGSKTLYLEKKSIDVNRIVPIIKDKRFVLEMQNLMGSFDKNHLYEKYNSELFIFYAEDLENSISYLMRKDLNTISLDFNELRKLSIKNLNSLIENIERNGNEDIFMLIAGGNYESSLILLDIWNPENFPVNGNLIVGIPSRDLLFITGENQVDDIKELKLRIQEINETGNHVVSNKLFRLNNMNQFDVLE